MSDRGKRISFSIDIPSEALLGLLRKALTDAKTASAMKKNPRDVLAAHCIAIDKSVTDESLRLFSATLLRARTYLLRKKVKAYAFEQAFSIDAAEADAKIVVPRKPSASTRTTRKNRGRSIEFQRKTEVLPNEKTNTENSINFGGIMDKSGPLLHIFTLSKLIVDLKIAMGDTK